MGLIEFENTLPEDDEERSESQRREPPRRFWFGFENWLELDREEEFVLA